MHGTPWSRTRPSARDIGLAAALVLSVAACSGKGERAIAHCRAGYTNAMDAATGQATAYRIAVSDGLDVQLAPARAALRDDEPVAAVLASASNLEGALRDLGSRWAGMTQLPDRGAAVAARDGLDDARDTLPGLRDRLLEDLDDLDDALAAAGATGSVRTPVRDLEETALIHSGALGEAVGIAHAHASTCAAIL